MAINKEKQEIIDCPGNILVTANPGTGKTLLLAHKYIHLLGTGIKPGEILCLTFTRKARKEMEDRIIELIKEKKLDVDLAELNIHTFHSYALDYIEEKNLVSTNLLRYSIFRFLKENNTLNYADNYLLDTIVPKMENLIRYLKSFGITYDQIDVDEVKKFITDFKQFTKEELEHFLENFVSICQYYEKMKGMHGLDYTDMLITFLQQKKTPRYRYVLIDELQDVNKMEADISLRSADNFVAVGDQKQAIFGFQGGSILNFKNFEGSTHFILSENFRSTNAILDFAREYFSTKTKEKQHVKALENLKNKEKEYGEKTVIYEVSKDEMHQAVCDLAKDLSKNSEQVAIIARTNSQIMRISKELQNRDIGHSSTFFSASSNAQASIITFLKGILSKKIQCVKAAMFTPFFPISLQDAFELSEKKPLTFQDITEKCPAFKKIMNSIGTVEDVNDIFQNVIMPVSISYGEEYFMASLAMMESFQEAMMLIDDKKIDNIMAFLESSDLLSKESSVEKNLVLTSVHKAKGKQFDTVIYIPAKTSDKSNFQDAVVKSILKSKGINAEEELEEETLRVNFVAFTRAKNRLYIITDKPREYANDFAVVDEISAGLPGDSEFSERKKKAYTLFVSKQYDEAKKLLETKETWLKEYVRRHFEGLESISFSALTDDAYEYLKSEILDIRVFSEVMGMGSEVHRIAEKIIKQEECELTEGLEPYKTNIERLVKQIHEMYPLDVAVEEKITVPLSKLVETDVSIDFSGKIDAAFKNNNSDFLIVDWKTSKDTTYGSSHRQQLSVYQKAYAIKHDVALDKIKVAIGYVGLRKTINDGKIDAELDIKQPSSSAFETFSMHLKTFLSWKKDVDLFFKELVEVKEDDPLLRSIIEQYNMEIK